jgi:DNA uptake protein ComE-like DNA-binding protein
LIVAGRSGFECSKNDDQCAWRRSGRIFYKAENGLLWLTLAKEAREVENDAMRTSLQWTAIALLCVSLVGVARSQDRDSSGAPKTSATAPSPEMRVDINHASVDELLKAPGMTRGWALRIVRYRPYHTKLDLLELGIVNSQVYDRIKDYVIAHRKAQ